MRRRAFISLWQFRQPDPRDEFRERLIAHLKAIDALARPFFGCTDEDVNTDTCRPWRARTDYKAYEAARRTAMKFFNLKD
jgi:hypothetical protein